MSMNNPPKNRLTPRKLKSLLGWEIGLSDWFAITQDRVDAFAECTEDRQSRDEPSARHSPVAYIHGRVRRKWTPG